MMTDRFTDSGDEFSISEPTEKTGEETSDISPDDLVRAAIRLRAEGNNAAADFLMKKIAKPAVATSTDTSKPVSSSA